LLEHWRPFGVRPLILCASEETAKRLSAEYPDSMTLLDYVKGFALLIKYGIKITKCSILGIPGCELVAQRLDDLSKKESRGRALFPEYWTQDQLLDGLSKGKLKKGKFKVFLFP
jgi:hypothetical protein